MSRCYYCSLVDSKRVIEEPGLSPFLILIDYRYSCPIVVSQNHGEELDLADLRQAFKRLHEIAHRMYGDDYSICVGIGEHFHVRAVPLEVFFENEFSV